EVALRRPRELPELRETIESALEELGRLSHLIDSLLTLARSDAGELPVTCVPLPLGEALEQVMIPYEAIALEREIHLVKDYHSTDMVVADRLWLGRAISNLVDNACKFTAPGGTIRVATEKIGGRMRVSVENSGTSFSAEERDRIFERFYRSPTA